ncbi:MAG TPA: LysE family translocator, partial [Burkholderiales bacterium]
MIPLDSVLVFFTASALLALAPGPDNIFVLTLSALHGRKAGLLVTLGLCTGLVGHTLAVALGIAALFQASAIAFAALKIAGACYLLYLAWGAFRASASPIEAKT